MTKIRTLMAIGLVVGMLGFTSSVLAIGTPVGLGTARSFVVLAGSTVTNTGPSVLNGDLGLSPGSAVTGFPPGQVNGTEHVADAVALEAQNDLTTAYNDAAGQPTDVTVSADLGGQRLAPGVYTSATSLGLTGTVTLDAAGDPNAVWVFQAGSTLTTASNSTVSFVNGAQACNVFWQVGSSATLGTNTTFVGTILALTSITLRTGTSVDGRVLARNGQVSLDDNVISRSNCAAPPAPTATPAPTAVPTATPAPTAVPTATPAPTATAAPSAVPTGAPAPTATATASPTATAAPAGPPGGITRGPVILQKPTTPPTDTLPAGASRDPAVNLGGILLALVGLLVFASTALLRRPARR